MDSVLYLLQELTETRHKLNEVQQQLQEGNAQAAQQEQQHKQAVARLTQDLQQEQQARSGFAGTPQACIIIIIKAFDVTCVKLTVKGGGSHFLSSRASVQSCLSQYI